MANQTISDRYDEVYIPEYADALRDEDRTCEICRYWLIDRNFPAYASVNGHTVKVGQCGCIEDTAPYAETLGAEAVVFTQAHGRCQGFEIDPEIAAEIAATARHCRQLDNQLTREARAM